MTVGKSSELRRCHGHEDAPLGERRHVPSRQLRGRRWPRRSVCSAGSRTQRRTIGGRRGSRFGCLAGESVTLCRAAVVTQAVDIDTGRLQSCGTVPIHVRRRRRRFGGSGSASRRWGWDSGAGWSGQTATDLEAVLELCPHLLEPRGRHVCGDANSGQRLISVVKRPCPNSSSKLAQKGSFSRTVEDTLSSPRHVNNINQRKTQ